MSELSYTQEQVANHIAHGMTESEDVFIEFGVGWATRTTIKAEATHNV